MKSLSVGFRARCEGGGSTSGTTTFAGPFRVRDGRFRVSGGAMTVRGEFPRRGRARGTLRWSGRSYSPSGASRSCDTGRVSWAARRR